MKKKKSKNNNKDEKEKSQSEDSNNDSLSSQEKIDNFNEKNNIKMTVNNITKKITYPKEKSNKKEVKGKKKKKKKSIKKKVDELKNQINIIKIDENKSEKFIEIKKDLIVKNEISLYFEKPIINNEKRIKNNFIFNNEPLENNEKNTIIETILAEMETEKSGFGAYYAGNRAGAGVVLNKSE